MFAHFQVTFSSPNCAFRCKTHTFSSQNIERKLSTFYGNFFQNTESGNNRTKNVAFIHVPQTTENTVLLPVFDPSESNRVVTTQVGMPYSYYDETIAA